jgi:uncharacterized protein (TIGR02246 family)
MKQFLAVMGIALIVAPTTLAETAKKQKAAASESLAGVRRAIDKGNAQWSEGWAKGDATLVASIFASDGVQLAGNGEIIRGRQEIRDRQKKQMETVDPGTKVTVTTTKVWLDGDLAYETGKYKYEYREKGKPAVDEGKYVTLWKRQKDGSWKLTMDMGVPNN